MLGKLMKLNFRYLLLTDPPNVLHNILHRGNKNIPPLKSPEEKKVTHYKCIRIDYFEEAYF